MSNTKTHYLTKDRRDQMKPALELLCRDEFDKAIEDVHASEEFQDAMEDFLSTPAYQKRLDSFGGENTSEEMANAIVKIVELLDPSEEDFNSYVKDTIFSGIINRKYNVYVGWRPVQDVTFDKDTYHDVLVDLIDTAIDTSIENDQKAHASHKLKLKAWLCSTDWAEFKAVLATAENGPLDEVKQYVKNSLDFQAMVWNK